MGTPEFARPPLVCLCDSKHELLAVVTGQDKKAGRGRHLLPTPCRKEAERRGLPVFTPARLDDDEFGRRRGRGLTLLGRAPGQGDKHAGGSSESDGFRRQRMAAHGVLPRSECGGIVPRRFGIAQEAGS